MISKKMKKFIVLFCVVLSSVLLLAACGEGDKKDVGDEKPAEEQVKVGIVLSVGGKGDKSFNDAAITGLEKAKQELGIEYKYIEPREMAQDEESLRFLAEQGMDLVIAVGFLMEKPLEKVAQEYPDVKFAIIDAVVDQPNVASLVFKEHEGSFLAGVLAAMLTQTEKVGFVGGMKIPLIEKFQAGYEHGVEYVNETEGKNVQVLAAYAGNTGKAFNDPAKGKELALSQIAQGADIVYHASGGTGQGVFEAAAEKGILAIGVDSNQNWMYPGTIVASMLKRVDVAVFETVKAVKEGTYQAGVQVFGVEDNGVGLTDLDKVTEIEKIGVENDPEKIEKIQKLKDSIPQEVKDKIAEIREKIINGEIVVRDSLK